VVISGSFSAKGDFGSSIPLLSNAFPNALPALSPRLLIVLPPAAVTDDTSGSLKSGALGRLMFGKFVPISGNFGAEMDGSPSNLGVDTDGSPSNFGREIPPEGITGAFKDLISGKSRDFTDFNTSLGSTFTLLMSIPLSLTTPEPIAAPIAIAEAPPTRGARIPFPLS